MSWSVAHLVIGVASLAVGIAAIVLRNRGGRDLTMLRIVMGSLLVLNGILQIVLGLA
jgi:hypothetical protein